jgi:glutathione peroxidase
LANHDVYGLSFTAIDGETLALADYKGKVLLMVNTASKCGFTKQYEGLQKLYDTYKDQGLVVIGMPCNDFGAQEPACALDIKTFTQEKFHVTFPLTDKVHIKGETPHPFFTQVNEQYGMFGSPHWNFYKYIVGRNGMLKTWFSPLTGPESTALVRVIEAELQAA